MIEKEMCCRMGRSWWIKMEVLWVGKEGTGNKGVSFKFENQSKWRI